MRIHGTTRRVPLDLFALERPLLRALPAIAPDLGTWHRVACIATATSQFERCLYSVPFALVGKTLWLRVTDGAVTVYQDYRQVATHPRASVGPGRAAPCAITCRRRHKHFFAHDRAVVPANRPRASAPPAPKSIDRLLADRIVERLRAAQGVLRLRDTYGAERVGGRLCPCAASRQPVLPHRQDHPGRRLRPPAAA